MLAFLDITDPLPYERGIAHGRAFAPNVAANIETTFRRLERGGLSPTDARQQAEAWRGHAGLYGMGYLDEMRGLAAGAQAHPSDVAVLNFRFEIGFPLMARRLASLGLVTEPDGCTSFVVMGARTAGGLPLIGQTLDGVAPICGNLVVLRRAVAPGRFALAVHEAGSVGPSVGLSSAGFGVTYNSLITPSCLQAKIGCPFRQRLWRALDATDYAVAVAALVDGPVPTATYVAIVSAAGDALGIELAGRTASVREPENDIMTHANHVETLPLTPSLFEYGLPDSLFRAHRLERLLGRTADHDHGTLAAALSDHYSHPAAICLHGEAELPVERRPMTLAAVVMDPAAGILHASDGPPCEGQWRTWHVAPMPVDDALRIDGRI